MRDTACDARHVPERLCGGSVYLEAGRSFTFYYYNYYHYLIFKKW